MMDERMLATLAVQASNEAKEIMFKCAICGNVWELHLCGEYVEVDGGRLEPAEPVIECPNDCLNRYRATFPENFHADGSLRVRD
jgi:hypothetical protein